jgi:hypothetical protein
MAAYGATSPFAQASLNDRLPHAYLPLVRGGRDSRNRLFEGRGDHLCFEKPTSGPVTRYSGRAAADFKELKA